MKKNIKSLVIMLAIAMQSLTLWAATASIQPVSLYYQWFLSRILSKKDAFLRSFLPPSIVDVFASFLINNTITLPLIYTTSFVKTN